MPTTCPIPDQPATCVALPASAPIRSIPISIPALPALPALPAAAAFYLLASITASFLAGSSAPTPLYRIYQAAWGFSPATVTVVFGIYALAVLAALLVAGRLSDHIGRRPVLLGATAAQVVAMAVFATADGVASLMVARVIQGLATGAAVAAVGAGLLDLDKARGAVANSVAPLLGTALGGVLAGLMVHFLPEPTVLVYLLLGALFVVQGIGVAVMPETIAPRAGALASLRPQFSLPEAVRGPLLRAVPILIATWALAGFYASLGPTLLRSLAGSDSALLGGLALFVLAGSGSVAVLLTQGRQPRALTSLGAGALIAGVAGALAAVSLHSVAGLFAATAIAGAGFGPAFQGALRTVVPLAAPRERAGVLAVIFVVCYLAMGVPAIIAGTRLAHGGNIVATAEQFGTIVIALAALALAGQLTSARARPVAAGAVTSTRG